jgi:hypothetical protein
MGVALSGETGSRPCGTKLGAFTGPKASPQRATAGRGADFLDALGTVLGERTSRAVCLPSNPMLQESYAHSRFRPESASKVEDGVLADGC